MLQYGMPWDKRDGGFRPKLWSRFTFWDEIPRPFVPSVNPPALGVFRI